MIIEMKIAGLIFDPTSNSPIIILKDLEGKNALPIWIGILEASAIATEMENIKPPRPMTHDLIKIMLDKLKATIEKIVVRDLKNNTFFADIYVKMGGVEYVIDARPSDSLALALRSGASIWVDRKVIEKSEKMDLQKAGDPARTEKEKLMEMLDTMDPKDFGKYKM